MNQITSDITPDPAAERPIYQGMEWSAKVRSSGQAGLWRASSDTTPMSYIAEEVEDGRWEARAGFTDTAGRPAVGIGFFPSDVIAMTACERHDYAFWKSSVTRSGHKPVFMGSPDRVADFVGALADHERDDLLDMIAGGYHLADGSSFVQSASFFPAVKSGLKQERNGTYTATLSIDAADLPMWLMQVAPGADLVIGAVPVDTGGSDEWQERASHALRRTFALAGDNNFHAWIAQRYDRWGLIATAMTQTSEEVEEAVSETLRRLIGCPSRRDLTTNRDAVMRLERIDREYYLDMSRGFVEAV